jgi:hypothetical protein
MSESDHSPARLSKKFLALMLATEESLASLADAKDRLQDTIDRARENLQVANEGLAQIRAEGKSSGCRAELSKDNKGTRQGKRYHISQDKSGEWLLTREGTKFVLGSFNGKAYAVESATKTVRKRGGSLAIHRADGNIVEVLTFPAQSA